jgi:NAD(P)-dependent dehydrogenase (short-subunit alcohol dehydrogenase family)
VALAPFAQAAQHREQVLARAGQLVLVPRRVVAVPAPLDDPGLLQLAQSQRQGLPRRARVDLDVLEAVHAKADLAQDEQAPPLADDVQRVRDRAHPGAAQIGRFAFRTHAARVACVLSQENELTRELRMSSVLITGASKGIGRATAVELAQRGHRVIATARDPRALDGLDADQKLRLDVTDQASVDSAVAQAGQVDTLVSNAGVIFRAAVEASPLDEIERLYRQNTVGAIRVTQAVLPQMRKRRQGRLVFVSSVGGRTVLPGNAAYAATKWALEAFAETLAIELADFGIDVTLAQPGPVSSGALDGPLAYRLPGDPYAALLAGGIPAALMSSPEEVAAAVADLVERPEVPLRVPVGAVAEEIIAARDSAPYDRPFVRG